MGARTWGQSLSCICALTLALSASAQSPQPHFGDIGRIVCAEGAEGAERYLPGDYYFCAANKALPAATTGAEWQGRRWRP